MDMMVRLGPTAFWPRFQAVFWTLEVLVGLAAIGVACWQLASAPWWVALGTAAVGLILTFTGVSMAGLCWITALAKGPVVEMTPQGFRDIRISTDVILWAGLEWDLCKAGRGRVSLQVGSSQPCRVRWPMRLQAPLNRLAGNPPWTVLTLGTGRSAEQIAHALAQFAP